MQGYGLGALPTLHGRQKRERLPRTAAAEIEFGRLLDRDRVHASERRAVAALLDELGHCRRRTGNQNLNGAVEAVADPTVEAEPQRLPFGPYAKTYFLDDAPDRQPFDVVRSDRHEESLRPLPTLPRMRGEGREGVFFAYCSTPTPNASGTPGSVAETRHPAPPA